MCDVGVRERNALSARVRPTLWRNLTLTAWGMVRGEFGGAMDRYGTMTQGGGRLKVGRFCRKTLKVYLGAKFE